MAGRRRRRSSAMKQVVRAWFLAIFAMEQNSGASCSVPPGDAASEGMPQARRGPRPRTPSTFRRACPMAISTMRYIRMMRFDVDQTRSRSRRATGWQARLVCAGKIPIGFPARAGRRAAHDHPVARTS
jgi:hypothetical protein